MDDSRLYNIQQYNSIRKRKVVSYSTYQEYDTTTGLRNFTNANGGITKSKYLSNSVITDNLSLRNKSFIGIGSTDQKPSTGDNS